MLRSHSSPLSDKRLVCLKNILASRLRPHSLLFRLYIRKNDASPEHLKSARDEACEVIYTSEQSSTDEKVSSNDLPISNKRGPVSKKPSRKRKWRKPKDMPKRPLSAYNLFFAHERQKLISSGLFQTAVSDAGLQAAGGDKKMGFAGLARNVAAKWKSLSPSMRSSYEQQAQIEQERYKSEVVEWKKNQEEQKTKQLQFNAKLAASVSAQTLAPYSFQDMGYANDSVMGAHRNTPAINPAIAGNHSQQHPAEKARFDAMSTIGTAIWPAMPQTIASLGGLYDASYMQEQASMQGNPRLSLERSSIGMLAVATENQSFNPSPMQSMTSPAGNIDYSLRTTQQDQRSGQVPEALASFQRIHKLASQLDDEAFDFLKSLNNSNPANRNT